MRSLNSSVETSTTKTGATLAASFMVGVSGYEIDLARLGTVAADMNYTWAALARPEVARLVIDGLKIMATQAPGLTVKLPRCSKPKLLKEEEGVKPGGQSWANLYTELAAAVYMDSILQSEFAGVIRDFVIALENLDINTGDTQADAEEQHQTRIDWQRRCNALRAGETPSLALSDVYIENPYRRGVDSLEALAAAYNYQYTIKVHPTGQLWTLPTFRVAVRAGCPASKA
ncbi:hypothetical protein GNI_034440 [Gregarina niphandrodes]|uniref:Uncharacterized protein n=1 Tax=Gregarina niphandrodes TaxID=110365 RepID=A0A023BB24_GRENI|nr:hypothetical protein GNI_034440 [Gregarina niphandrodes]EZG78606.1 hypothetical protein GNI_034440 [Gregarina niphandrodes]|eukprot:XP_011129244.1 hypothetical protein GNI_034440 [Gregarina niphandrodes]